MIGEREEAASGKLAEKIENLSTKSELTKLGSKYDNAISQMETSELHFYINCVMNKGSIEWLGNNYPRTLAVIWARVLVRFEKAKDTHFEEELKTAYLSPEDIEFLAVGREILREEREKEAAEAAAKSLAGPSSSGQHQTLVHTSQEQTTTIPISMAIISEAAHAHATSVVLGEPCHFLTVVRPSELGTDGEAFEIEVDDQTPSSGISFVSPVLQTFRFSLKSYSKLCTSLSQLIGQPTLPPPAAIQGSGPATIFTASTTGSVEVSGIVPVSSSGPGPDSEQIEA